MCDVAGFSGKFGQVLLERMSAAVAHRGPDDAGVPPVRGPADPVAGLKGEAP